MYDALHEPSLTKMNNITKSAIGMVTVAYLCVRFQHFSRVSSVTTSNNLFTSISFQIGYFGYVAFCDEEISGDILLSFKPTIFSEAVKMGFVIAVAASFPLVIFPLRASIYTLCFQKVRHIIFQLPVLELHVKLSNCIK